MTNTRQKKDRELIDRALKQLERDAYERGAKLEAKYGASAYGGTTWLNESGYGKKTQEDIAPVKNENTWLKKGALENGSSATNVSKTILGSATDLTENLLTGVVGVGEKVVDAAAYAAGGVGKLFGADQFASDMEAFIAKDLYDERNIAKTIVSGLNTAGFASSSNLGLPASWSEKDNEWRKKKQEEAMDYVTNTAEADSVFGEKADSLVQSIGQQLATRAGGAVGVPWELTMALTSFGAEAENALNSGATFGQAGASATISAAAEIISEKLFSGGIINAKGWFGNDKGAVDALGKGLAVNLWNTLKGYAKDIGEEAFEEVFSEVIGRFGTAIYKVKTPEELGELMLGKDAWTDYFDAAIGGGIMGGLAGGKNAVVSAATGRDYSTGMTQNEQKVVKAEYEKRVEEASKKGDVSKKEKDKIYDAVVSDMEKGQISTDTIEEVLGGDTYKAYQDSVKNEDSLRETFNALNQMKQSEMTGEQIDLRNELKEKLKEMESQGQRSQLKSKLGEEVFGLVQNDRLMESYNERGRRSQAFEADLTKYDAKSQATIKRAVESGILNNTRRTHEFVNMIAKISADKGVLFDFTNNEKLRGSVFAVDGKTVNGYVTKDGVTLNIDSAKSLNSVVGHEITHVLEGTELYTALQSAVVEYAKSKGDYQGRYDSLSKLYEGVKDADVDAELTADLVGDYLFTDTDFINNLATNKNVFQKIYDEIKYLCKVATAGSKEARELEKVKRAFEKAYQQSGKVSNDTKYSVSDANQMESSLNTLKRERSELEDQLDMAHFNDLSDAEVRKLKNRLTKVQGDIDKIIAEERKAAVLTPMQTIIDNLGRYRRNDLESLAEQISDSAWDDYEDLSRSELEDAIREVIRERELSPLEMQSKKFGLYVRPVGTAKYSLSDSDGEVSNDTKYSVSEIPLDQRLSGDALLDAEDLISEIESVAKVSPNGYVTVYHRTTTENAKKIMESGKMSAKEDGIFFSTQKNGVYSADYGDGVVELKVPAEKLVIDDIFDTEAHLRIPLKNRREVLDVSAYLPNSATDTKYSLSDSDGKPIDSARISADEFDTKYSLSHNGEIAKGQTDYIGKHKAYVTDEELAEAQRVTAAMVDVMMKYSNILPEDKIGKVLTKNGSYDRSVENTTICVRTLAYNEFVDKVQEELGRPLTQMESFLVSQKLYDIATEPQCLYCYVSLDRKAFNNMLLRYMTDRDTVIAKYNNSDKSPAAVEALYEEFLHGRKPTKEMRTRFDAWLGYVDDGVQLLSLADIATEDRQGVIKANGGILAEQLKDARKYAQSASWSKIQKNYVAYRDEILKLGDRVVKNLNEHYGLRWYSFSDYSAAFIVENMQQITDASIRGLKGLAYTKDTDFAEIFAPSGMNINISVFVNTDKDGNFFIDEKQSAKLEQAKALRERYPNVGIVATVTNDDALRWAASQEWSDVIIPFHIVRTGTDVAEYYKWLNYTSESADTIADKDMWNAYVDSLNLKSEGARKKVSKNIYPNEHKNDKSTYLALCESRGLTPRFVRFAGEDWYMKLVNETRLSADASATLKPIYDEEAAKASFQKFVDKGGYEGGWYHEGVDVDAEARAVADDVLAGKRANEVSYGRQDGFVPEDLIASRKTNRQHGRFSLSEQGEQPFAPIRSSDIYGKDIRLETAVPETVAPVVEEVGVSKTETAMFPDDTTPASDEAATTENWRDVVKSLREPGFEDFEDYKEVDTDPETGEEKVVTGRSWNEEYLNHNNYIRVVVLEGATREVVNDVESGLSSAELAQKSQDAIQEYQQLQASKPYGEAYTEAESLMLVALYNQYSMYDSVARNPSMVSEFKKTLEYAPVVSAETTTAPVVATPDEEEVAPVMPMQETTPKVTEKYEAIKPKREKQPKLAKATPAERATAEILTEDLEVEKKRSGISSVIKNKLLDKGMVFEDLSLKTGNRELQAKWNSIRYAEGKAQRFMEKGNASVSSLKSIRDTVEKSGKTKEFYEYMYHNLNVDRMTLAQRYENTPNKPVFGDSVTADLSTKAAADLERANPEFKQYAKEVYSYMNYLRELMVENGVISRETAKLWQEMYPHYVPVGRVDSEGLAINVPLDTRRTGINAPIKSATGGNSGIRPLFKVMGERTLQTYKAIAKNRFGVELKNTLGQTISNDATSVDEIINSIDTHDELLQRGKNGRSPTFTVFENGKKVTFDITDEMYDAMKPKSDAYDKINKSRLGKVLNTANNVRRGLLTEYNPAFVLTNPIKDTQDVVINSQHPAKTYANYPKAIAELWGKSGHWYQEYMENGGEQNTYFDTQTHTFKEQSTLRKVVGFPLDKISEANNFIERIPRMAEYIASRKMGRSIDVAMLDAARVTTNFAAGGDLTKLANRNGFTFLNASVQGAIQQVRNVREAKANGLKGAMILASKIAVAGLPSILLNHLLWDDDEEYAELSDYVKQNYYIVGKYGDGKFVRIPKGRALAVIQNAFEQMENAVTGNDDVDLATFGELVINNLAPSNPLENNLLAPIAQAWSNKTWYGDDLVPTRLQDLPSAEQYDETTDSISKWLGERTPFSPYKINYVLDQYSGAIGDVFLPRLTLEAERGNNSWIAPISDKFTTDSVMKNQNISDFYDLKDELTVNANGSKATDEDVLKYKYINSVNAEMGKLYGEKREIQNGDMPDAEKYEAVREIQKQIDSLARDSLAAYDDVSIKDGYATVADRQYRLKDGAWSKLTNDQIEKQDKVTSGLGISPSEYWSNKEEYDFAYEKPEKYAVAKSVGGYEAYTGYSKELNKIKGVDNDGDGRSDTGTRKEKVLDWVNGLDADYGTKIILFKSEYNADDTYNYDIIDYLNGRNDISYEEMVTILKELGFEVSSNGTVSW